MGQVAVELPTVGHPEVTNRQCGLSEKDNLDQPSGTPRWSGRPGRYNSKIQPTVGHPEVVWDHKTICVVVESYRAEPKWLQSSMHQGLSVSTRKKS